MCVWCAVCVVCGVKMKIHLFRYLRQPLPLPQEFRPPLVLLTSEADPARIVRSVSFGAATDLLASVANVGMLSAVLGRPAVLVQFWESQYASSKSRRQPAKGMFQDSGKRRVAMAVVRQGVCRWRHGSGDEEKK